MPLVGLEMADVGGGGFDASCYVLLREIELSATLPDYATERAFIRPCHDCVSFFRQQRAPAKRTGSKQLSRPDSLGVRPTVLTQGRTQTPDFLAVILNHYGPANRPAMEL